MTTVLNLVSISGSLRSASFNTSLLRAVEELAPPSLTFTRLHYDDFPVFNEDLEEGGLPPQVVAMQRAIQLSDGLIIATPEYNHSVPGGLKNAIDWLSRGPAPHGLFGVPTAILGASNGGFGTTRSQYHLRQVLTTLNAPTMQAPQILVTNAGDKFDTDGRLTDEMTRKFLGKFCVAAERWMRRFPIGNR